MVVLFSQTFSLSVRKGEQCMANTNNNFIMLPTVDFCFKKLMDNAKVRQGFIAALLKMDPDMIRETTVLPTELEREYADDKLGVLDVRVLLGDGKQLDMEMQVAYFGDWDARALFYLSKIFTEQEETIISWMRFLGGKSREEFEDMAKLDEYMSEAYETLKKISADDRAKLEYEARQKAIRDYNSQMISARREGLEEGIEKGEILNKIKLVKKKYQKGKSLCEIAEEMEEEVSAIEKIYQMVKENPESSAEEILQMKNEEL